MTTYYEFEVSLAHLKPRIWRRFQITSVASFADLHDAIQIAFGWFNEHMWEFTEKGLRGKPIACIPDTDFEIDDDRPDAFKVNLSKYFERHRAGKQCRYIYDFGDGWDHKITLKKKITEPGDFFRRLLAGKRACPLEDCGGVGGYERMADFVKTGKDPHGGDAGDLADWTEGWHPDEFELEVFQRAFDQ